MLIIYVFSSFLLFQLFCKNISQSRIITPPKRQSCLQNWQDPFFLSIWFGLFTKMNCLFAHLFLLPLALGSFLGCRSPFLCFRCLTPLSCVSSLLAVVISSYILAPRSFPSGTLAVTKLYDGISHIFYCPGCIYKGLHGVISQKFSKVSQNILFFQCTEEFPMEVSDFTELYESNYPSHLESMLISNGHLHFPDYSWPNRVVGINHEI